MDYKAREIYQIFGYIQWRNFDNLVKKAIQLIGNGTKKGSIIECSSTVKLGSGAVRKVIDYSLDENAYNLLKELASSYKLTKVHSTRNETVLFTLLKKYCELRGLSFKFQYKLDKFIFDFFVDDKFLIEFDEPHHEGKRQQEIDRIKNNVAKDNNLKILRFGIKSDIIDIIIAIT